MIAVYGAENPTMRWLMAYAPQVLEERAGAEFQPEEDICGE